MRSVAESTKALETAIRLERLILGETTSNTSVSVEERQEREVDQLVVDDEHYDADGIQDFISGSYDPGDLDLFRGLGRGEYAAVERTLDEDGVPLVHHPEQLVLYERLGKEKGQTAKASSKPASRRSAAGQLGGTPHPNDSALPQYEARPARSTGPRGPKYPLSNAYPPRLDAVPPWSVHGERSPAPCKSSS